MHNPVDNSLIWEPHPFPHCVYDDFLDAEEIFPLANEFPQLDHPFWTHYSNDLEEKWEGSNPHMWGPNTVALAEFLASDTWCHWLEHLTGIPSLTADFTGGGYHQIQPGGYLGMHVDFNRGGQLYRRLNFILFLNLVWSDGWGGCLQLGTGEEALLISPRGGNAVIFETSDRSWHGHPEPLRTPNGIARKSFACYYFSPEPPPDYSEDHSTVFSEVTQ